MSDVALVQAHREQTDMPRKDAPIRYEQKRLLRNRQQGTVHRATTHTVFGGGESE